MDGHRSYQLDSSQSSTPELCHLSSIHVLDLSKNNISGRIPHCFSNFTYLSQHDSPAETLLPSAGWEMSENNSVVIDSYIENALVTWKYKETEYTKTTKFLKLIDLSSNKLVGNIPKEFLNLSRNHLTGDIDSNIGNMTMLESLDLSRNQLSGRIPTGLGQLSFLSVLDLSNNNLSGIIPTGTQLQGFDASAYAGNGLCALPLQVVLKFPSKNEGHNYFDKGFYISVASGFALGFWGAIAISLFHNSWGSALFNFWNKTWNWLYVMTVIYARRLRR